MTDELQTGLILIVAGSFVTLIGFIYNSVKSKNQKIKEKREPVNNSFIKLIVLLNRTLKRYSASFSFKDEVELHSLFNDFTRHLESSDHELSDDMRDWLYEYRDIFNKTIVKLMIYYSFNERRKERNQTEINDKVRIKEKEYNEILSQIYGDLIFDNLLEKVKLQALNERD